MGYAKLKNVVYAINKNYSLHLLVSLLSLLKNNASSQFNIYVICNSISLEHYKAIEYLASRYCADIEKISIEEGLFDALPKGRHFSNANYYRLLIPELVPASKVLYLDADTIINGCIDELYSPELQEYCIGAIEDIDFDQHGDLITKLNMSKHSKYFNSGVMLLNLDAWRKVALHKQVIEFASDNPDLITFVDQCALNAVLDGKWEELDPRFNMQSSAFQKEHPRYLPTHHDFVIVHFTGASKPWQDDCEHPMKHLYQSYLNQVKDILGLLDIE